MRGLDACAFRAVGNGGAFGVMTVVEQLATHKSARCPTQNPYPSSFTLRNHMSPVPLFQPNLPISEQEPSDLPATMFENSNRRHPVCGSKVRPGAEGKIIDN